MKSLIEINAKIVKIQESTVGNTGDLFMTGTPQKVKKSKEMAQLLFARNLLETSPSEEYLNSELKRLTELVKSKSDPKMFLKWKKDIAPKNLSLTQLKSLYNKETGVTLANRQIKTLKYILSNG